MNIKITAITVSLCLLTLAANFSTAAGTKTANGKAKTKTVQAKKNFPPVDSVAVMINGEEWRFQRDSVSFTNGMWDNAAQLAVNKNIKVGNLQFEFIKEHPIEFYSDGSVRRGFISATARVGTAKLTGDILFYHNGTIGRASIAEDCEIQKLKFRKNSEIFFYDMNEGNFKVEKGILAEDTIINGVKIGRESEIHLADSGETRLISARMLQDERVGDFRFRRTTTVTFHQTNGKIQSGVISVSSLIDGKFYPPDTHVSFDENGKLISAVSQ